MRPMPLANATRRLSAPDDWDHEKQGLCETLEICDVDGYMVSAWAPSPAELVRLNEGHVLFLYMSGEQHPVVALVVGGAEG